MTGIELILKTKQKRKRDDKKMTCRRNDRDRDIEKDSNKKKSENKTKQNKGIISEFDSLCFLHQFFNCWLKLHQFKRFFQIYITTCIHSFSNIIFICTSR
jgi:hypothetical protein